MPKLKSCPNCRALIDTGEKTCPYCGDDLMPRTREVGMATTTSPGLITGYLIGICVVIFIFELIATLGMLGPSGMWQGLVLGVPGEILLQMGGRYAPLIQEDGQWWRLVVPVFLHGSFIHLLFNGFALVQVGPLAEQAYGRARFLIIFVVSGALGNVLGIMMNLGGVGIGASGALFGLIGAAGLYGHRRGDSFGRMIRRVMVQWGLYALVFGFLIRADNTAHIGGLLSGLLLSFIVGHPRHAGDGIDRLWTSIAVVVGVVTLISFALAIYGYTAYAARRPL